jgi:hypothetical protein
LSKEWHSKLAAALGTLNGKILTGAWVKEMALYGPEDAGHFTDRNLKFVQATTLELRTSDSGTFWFSCWQDNDEFALWPQTMPEEKRLAPDPGEGTFRTRPMHEFPLGRVDEVTVAVEPNGNMQEIRITVDQREVFLRAGEVYENMDGTLTVHDHDESVLVFLDREAYATLIFGKPIYTPDPITSA